MLASKVNHIEDTSTPEINRAIDQASEKGASSWLNVIPLEENGFNLTKGEFRDFSVLGAEGPETSTFHRYIATKIASKTEERYEKVLSLIRCKLSFLILKSALMCIRGSRPSDRESVTIDDFSLS